MDSDRVLISDLSGKIKQTLKIENVKGVKFFRDELYIFSEKSIFNIEMKILIDKLESIRDIEFIDESIYIATKESIKVFDWSGELKSSIDIVANSLTFLEEKLFFIDEVSLNYIEDSKIHKIDSLNTAVDIISGKGGCGAFRVFIAENKSLKVYDPIGDNIQIILDNLSEVESIAKYECDLYIKEKSKIKKLCLKSFNLSEIILD